MPTITATEQGGLRRVQSGRDDVEPRPGDVPAQDEELVEARHRCALRKVYLRVFRASSMRFESGQGDSH